MPFSRSARTDRRRRVMREVVATDPGVAVETVRARRRRVLDRQLEEDSDLSNLGRDPGYSQAVRRACQQRLVQLIPVRPSSLWCAILVCWSLWAVLLAAHYFVHIRQNGPLLEWPISLLVHLRSTHGIAYWLGSQLWMLTALAAVMIFQLRRHKLDDYRAKYRLWIFLAIAALFSSLDVSSSGLFLLGKTLDRWAISEVGYNGWTVVLATFAGLVGVLGIRLCSELKVAPLSLAFWLFGLLAWGSSALIGTSLVKSPWNQPTTDLVVGGAWLGGIMSVFLSAGLYLRHIYIQAQRRFILRKRMLQPKGVWRLPKWKRRDEAVLREPELETQASRSKHRRKEESELESAAAIKNNESEDAHLSQNRLEPKRRWFSSFGLGNRRQDSESATDQKARPKRKWLRLPRWRSDPRLGDDYSDVSAERRKRDEGFDAPMPKKAGWFAKKEKTSKHLEGPDTDRISSNRHTDEGESQSPDRSTMKRSWFRRSKITKDRLKSDTEQTQPKSSYRWWRRKSKKATIENQSPKPMEPKSKSSAPQSDQTKKRKWFSMFDGLKLKPPSAASETSSVSNATNRHGPTPVSPQSPSIPSSSSSQNQDRGRPNPSTSSRSVANYNGEDDDDISYRGLSKAERKRLKRQHQDNRRAA